MPAHCRIFRFLVAGLLAVPTGAMWGEEAPADRDEIIHVLNRITFGPRPGDVERVQKMGLHTYIEQQLHPETIDDSAVDQEISKFELLQMTPEQLATIYIDEHNKAAKQAKKARKAAKADLIADSAPSGQPMATKPVQTTDAQDETEGDEVAKPEVTMQAASAAANPEAAGADTEDRNRKRDEWHSVAAIGQLEQAKLVRAIESERQLQEVLADFWNNHFNIDVKKKTCRVTKIVDDRDVIRPRIWGKFRDLLEASAKSPAMLYYLDNATNTVAPPGQATPMAMMEKVADQTPPAAPAGKVKKKKQGGINENYAREVMELHTLGVDGGYTQNDVQEVARCFTGWGVDRKTGEFAFHADLHDNGAKVVLGRAIPAGGGMQDGETVLDLLASNPASAHHISMELCQRFVADAPPAALVDRIAGVFTKSGGDLRQVTEAILTSPEFLSPATYGNKVKSPFEFAVSAVRASESTIIAHPPLAMDKRVAAIEGQAIASKKAAVADRMAARPEQSLNYHIFELGEPLFACTPPTGYKEVSSSWVSSGALIERLNFAMALTGQRLSDVRFEPGKILNRIDLDQPDAVLNQCVSVLLQDKVSDSTRKVLEQTALPVAGASATVNPAKLIALIIGSPEFQRK